MNNRQLENVLYGWLGDSFCGVWASDQLPYLTRSFRTPAYFIVNTHPGHMPGEHWLALTLEENGTATFFDSFGFPPYFPPYPSTLLRFLEDGSPDILYQQRQLQHLWSTVCGQHCVYYLCQPARALSFEQTLSLYHHDLQNDLRVSQFVDCLRPGTAASFEHSACSLHTFKECYRV